MMNRTYLDSSNWLCDKLITRLNIQSFEEGGEVYHRIKIKCKIPKDANEAQKKELREQLKAKRCKGACLSNADTFIDSKGVSKIIKLLKEEKHLLTWQSMA